MGAWYNLVMETYKYTIKLKVAVEAMDEVDAKEAVNDIFGPGDDCGVVVESLEFTRG